MSGAVSVEIDGDVLCLVNGDQRIRIGPAEQQRLLRKIERGRGLGRTIHMGVALPEEERSE